jgi:hypothetical protein
VFWLVNLYSLLVYMECMFNKWGVSLIRWDVFITQVKLCNDYSNLLRKEKHFSCSYLTAVGCKNRQKENWATEDPMGRRSQENNTRTVVKNQWWKTSGNEYTHTTSIKVAFLDIDHLVIKYWSSPWYYQKAITLMGII